MASETCSHADTHNHRLSAPIGYPCQIADPQHNIIFHKARHIRVDPVIITDVSFGSFAFHNDKLRQRSDSRKFLCRIFVAACHARHKGSMSLGISARYDIVRICRLQRAVDGFSSVFRAIGKLLRQTALLSRIRDIRNALIPNGIDPCRSISIQKRGDRVINPLWCAIKLYLYNCFAIVQSII